MEFLHRTYESLPPTTLEAGEGHRRSPFLLTKEVTGYYSLVSSPVYTSQAVWGLNESCVQPPHVLLVPCEDCRGPHIGEGAIDTTMLALGAPLALCAPRRSSAERRIRVLHCNAPQQPE